MQPGARRIRLPDVSTDSWFLDCGESLQGAYPTTFSIPGSKVRRSLRVGMTAKLIFAIAFEEDAENDDHMLYERMWAVVREIRNDQYLGWLTNVPFFVQRSADEYLVQWCEVPFEARHVIDVMEEDYLAARPDALPSNPSRTWK